MAERKKIPEIRFKGFSGEWEERELGKIAKITMGQSPNSENYTDNPEYHILVQGNADMKNGKVVPRVWTKQVTKTADAEDLIMSVRAPVGEVGKTAYNVVIGRGVAAIKGNEFIFQSLKRMNENGYWNQFSAGSTFDSINSDDLSKAVVSTTKNDEQSQIGTYFKHLDTLITLHQNKYNKLVTIKKSMLEKMFPKNGATIPEIRFKGFDGAWEERKFENEVEFFSGLTYSPNDVNKQGTFVLRSSNVKNGEIVNADNVYVDTEIVNSSNVREGDIIVVVRNGSRSLIGKHAQIKGRMDKTVIGAFMTGIRSNQSTFINALLDTQQFNSEVEKNLGATINQITNGMFREMQFMFPGIREQNQIGTFFKQTDDLLTLQKFELEKLKNIKKAMLEKMFV